MANLNSVDLMSIGKHCDEKSCRQLDFLPFTCDFCNESFCSEHREPRQHSCRAVIDNNSRLLKCPLCDQHVLKRNGTKEDNDQMEKHITSGCQKLLMQKRKKNRCSNTGCRTINLVPLQCNSCYQQLCVRHRHPGDHKCIKQDQRRPIAVR